MMLQAVLRLALASVLALADPPPPGACKTAMDCSLNGDCVGGTCQCDPAWSASPGCNVMAFLPVDRDSQPGYHNKTEASWGGYPVQDHETGQWNLFVAQMLYGCGVLASWNTNSFVARLISTSGKVEGPYQFVEEAIPQFAHNPTIRRAPDGTYVIYFIGGWPKNATHCGAEDSVAVWDVDAAEAPSWNPDLEQAPSPPPAPDPHPAPPGFQRFPGHCISEEVFPPGHEPNATHGCGCAGMEFVIRYSPCGFGPYGTNKSCFVEAQKTCAANSECKSFVIRNDQGAFVAYKGLTNASACVNTGWTAYAKTCTPDASDPNKCLAPCSGNFWPKRCGPDMPGPSSDCCGGTVGQLNGGCGLAMAHSTSLSGPWTVEPLNISDQWLSDEVYCAHTNPSPFYLPNGTIIIVFNAGFCANSHLETIGIAVADSWKGPFRLLAKEAILRNKDGSPHRCEDPFVWHDGKRGWHLLVHNQQPLDSVDAFRDNLQWAAAAHAYSEDARNWTISPVPPYTCQVNFTDGTNVTVQGCGNRPQMVFEGGQSGGKPLWITNGGQSNKPDGGKGEFTLFRKIKVEVDDLYI